MVSTNIFLALAAVILWLAGIVLTTVKYLRAFRAGKRLDAWIWFISWCVFISLVEWFVFFGYSIIAMVFGLKVEL